jgi:hypothetical protein
MWILAKLLESQVCLDYWSPGYLGAHFRQTMHEVTRYEVLLEIKAEDETNAVRLLVRRFGSIVHMLVVAIDFRSSANRKDKSDIFCGPAPLLGCADIVSFAAHIRGEMVGVNSEGPLHRQPVTITPREISVNPPQVGLIPIGNQEARFKGEPWCRDEHSTILGRFAECRKDVISNANGQGPGLGFVELKDGESLQLEKRLRKDINVGSELRTDRVARLLRSRGVKHEPKLGVKPYIRVDLGPELFNLLRSCGRSREQNG